MPENHRQTTLTYFMSFVNLNLNETGLPHKQALAPTL
jgi:hypothetical protein